MTFCKECINGINRKNYVGNRDNHNKKKRERAKDYYQRWKKNPGFMALKRQRDRIRTILKKGESPFTGRSKIMKTIELLGCDKDTLIKHLESLFQPGMDWSNIGEWEIDHIMPCSSFNLTDIEEQKKCFHYTNLQPLWKMDNRRKGKKILLT